MIGVSTDEGTIEVDKLVHMSERERELYGLFYYSIIIPLIEACKSIASEQSEEVEPDLLILQLDGIT